MCTKHWLNAFKACPGKSVVRCTDRPAMTIAVDLGRQATKQQIGCLIKQIFTDLWVFMGTIMYLTSHM